MVTTCIFGMGWYKAENGQKSVLNLPWNLKKNETCEQVLKVKHQKHAIMLLLVKANYQAMTSIFFLKF